ncbi:hypothetical protein [Caulobacter sp. 17J65-9]|uniref:hypothetical protein n=1 Tax=Caulobacter sp. 17J65-9 TaxID=2709382 RepID=UPI0013C6D10B|nr:hypothetical protein [Caulobacter sp. 17J65-9]NEX91213.1 hypothetical protein [Caulobacter sp. 17J65-9]
MSLVTWTSEGRSRGPNSDLSIAAMAGRLVENGLMAVGLMGVVSLGLGGMTLSAAARIWGSFWTHYANASDEARGPVLAALVGVWAVLTALVGWFRNSRTGARSDAGSQIKGQW